MYCYNLYIYLFFSLFAIELLAFVYIGLIYKVGSMRMLMCLLRCCFIVVYEIKISVRLVGRLVCRLVCRFGLIVLYVWNGIWVNCDYYERMCSGCHYIFSILLVRCWLSVFLFCMSYTRYSFGKGPLIEFIKMNHCTFVFRRAFWFLFFIPVRSLLIVSPWIYANIKIILLSIFGILLWIIYFCPVYFQSLIRKNRKNCIFSTKKEKRVSLSL